MLLFILFAVEKVTNVWLCNLLVHLIILCADCLIIVMIICWSIMQRQAIKNFTKECFKK